MLTNENVIVSWFHGPRAWPVTYEKSLTVIPYNQMPCLKRNFDNTEISKEKFCLPFSEGRTALLQLNMSNISIADNAMHISHVKMGAEACCKSKALSYTSTPCLFHHCFIGFLKISFKVHNFGMNLLERTSCIAKQFHSSIRASQDAQGFAIIISNYWATITFCLSNSKWFINILHLECSLL